MNTNQPKKSEISSDDIMITASGPKSKVPMVIVLSLLAVALLAGGAYGIIVLTSDDSRYDMETFEVEKGPMRISVTLSGQVMPLDETMIRSEVEGQNKILSLIDDGKIVRKGDLLVELDSSSKVDQLAEQKIRVENAKASFIQARENRNIVISQGNSDIARAKLDVQFAIQDEEKYVKGQYPQDLQKADSDIAIASEELTRADDKYKDSEKLEKKGFITRTELKGDELAFKRAEIDLSLANGRLNLLKKYTYTQQVTKLASDIDQANMALDRIESKAKANNTQADATMNAREQEWNRQKEKQTKITEQIGKCKIYAPHDGTAVHATTGMSKSRHRGNVQQLAEGIAVQERQELIKMPSPGKLKIEANIPETVQYKVKVGQPVLITCDSRPGKIFTGRVAKKASKGTDPSFWSTDKVKFFPTVIYLVGDTDGIEAGLNSQVEIIVKQFDDAIHIPIQAVFRVDGQAKVQLAGSKTAHDVEIGMDDSSHVIISKGLEPGQRVVLNPNLTILTKSSKAGTTRTKINIDNIPEIVPPKEDELTFEILLAMPKEELIKRLGEMSREQKKQLNLTREQYMQLAKKMGMGRPGGGGGGSRPGNDSRRGGGNSGSGGGGDH